LLFYYVENLLHFYLADFLVAFIKQFVSLENWHIFNFSILLKSQWFDARKMFYISFEVMISAGDAVLRVVMFAVNS